MELKHSFTVPLGVEDTWTHFEDIAALAECFPGAVVTGVEGDTFSGTVKVKLGPIALQYAGSGTFVEKDDAAHRFVVEAKGKDKRGNGTAGATVTLVMSGDAASTDVQVDTDLNVTGKPAQFGRGVMQDVSDKLLGQFVSCLEQRLAAPEPAAATDGDTAAEPATSAAGAPSGVAGSGSAPAADETPIGSSAAAAAAAGSGAGSGPAGGVRPIGSAPSRSAPAGDDALDLGATVLPVLLRTYGPKIGAGLGVLLVLVLLRRLLR
ncbi:SRPBCC family protein [Nocardioides sp.]|uniref:SRPBCC family protein n=1 Tax=Nocardioides sp. TaxID=35761 RepID=UPI002637202A|nr:SRPBCC family protein [Nocardioides sp.]